MLPLDLSDCLLDSPYFRANLASHEHNLALTATSIKSVIRDITEVLKIAKDLNLAKLNLARNLASFSLDNLSTTSADDVVIANALSQMSTFMSVIEEEMQRMLRNSSRFVEPLEKFRRDILNSLKSGRDLEKATSRFCSAQDRFVALPTNLIIKETLRQEEKLLKRASLHYVKELCGVEERIKFEFVEALLHFVKAWNTYYRHGANVAEDFEIYGHDLGQRLQRRRENFEKMQTQFDENRRRICSQQDPGQMNKMYGRQGYLFVQHSARFHSRRSNRSRRGSSSAWIKCFCQYRSQDQTLTLIPYTQMSSKIAQTQSLKVLECNCSSKSRLLFEINAESLEQNERNGSSKNNYFGNSKDNDYNNEDSNEVDDEDCTHVFMALSELEAKKWIQTLGGKLSEEHINEDQLDGQIESNESNEICSDYERDQVFFRACLNEIERRGMRDEGLYRVGATVSKVRRLLRLGTEGNRLNMELSKNKEWETKTIAGVVKHFLRDAKEPLLTYELYEDFLDLLREEDNEYDKNEENNDENCLETRATSLSTVLASTTSSSSSMSTTKLYGLSSLIRRLPPANLEILQTLIKHLSKVSSFAAQNRMNAANLSVCFGPTLLRSPEDETCFEDIRKCNRIVQLLIENYDYLFNDYNNYVDSMRLRRAMSKTSTNESSHNSLGKLSTHSLPDILQGRRGKLSVNYDENVTNNEDNIDSKGNGKKNGDRNNNECSLMPSISNEFEEPDVFESAISGLETSLIRQESIIRKASTEADLMASLHMMNSLAADLTQSRKTRHSTTILQSSSNKESSNGRQKLSLDDRVLLRGHDVKQDVLDEQRVLRRPRLPVVRLGGQEKSEELSDEFKDVHKSLNAVTT